VSRHRLPSNSAPAEIGGGATICATSLDERHVPTRNARHLDLSGDVAAVAALAICRVPGSSGVFLYYCKDNWVPLADTWHDSVEAAMAQAEFEFAGVGETWAPAGPRDR
jgi:hypothetical protein